MSKKTKTEHSGAKNGGGYWGKREEAKQRSKELRRAEDRELEREGFEKSVDEFLEENRELMDSLAELEATALKESAEIKDRALKKEEE